MNSFPVPPRVSKPDTKILLTPSEPFGQAMSKGELKKRRGMQFNKQLSKASNNHLPNVNDNDDCDDDGVKKMST